MSNVTQLPPADNPPSADSGIKRLCAPLDLAEAERAAWLAFRASHRTFHETRTLTAEIVMIEARDRWAIAFRRVEFCGVAA